MLYAILCYNDEKVTGSWSKEDDDACMVRLNAVGLTKRVGKREIQLAATGSGAGTGTRRTRPLPA